MSNSTDYAAKHANRAIARDILSKGAEVAQRGGFVKTLAQGVTSEFQIWSGYQVTMHGEQAAQPHRQR